MVVNNHLCQTGSKKRRVNEHAIRSNNLPCPIFRIFGRKKPREATKRQKKYALLHATGFPIGGKCRDFFNFRRQLPNGRHSKFSDAIDFCLFPSSIPLVFAASAAFFAAFVFWTHSATYSDFFKNGRLSPRLHSGGYGSPSENVPGERYCRRYHGRIGRFYGK